MSLKQMHEMEFEIDQFEKKRAVDNAFPDTEAGGIVYCGKCGSMKPF